MRVRIIEGLARAYQRKLNLKQTVSYLSRNCSDKKIINLAMWAYRLMLMQEGTLTNSQILKYCTSFNKIQELHRTRRNKRELAEMLRRGRAEGQVFYLLSRHSKPAPDHREYQGKVYVDRFWKQTLQDRPDMYRAVAAYIRNRGIKTVQEITKAPVYMITRPYCKHRFIAVDNQAVLGNGPKKLLELYPEARETGWHRDYRTKYYWDRSRIHRALGMLSESKWDEKIARRKRDERGYRIYDESK